MRKFLVEVQFNGKNYNGFQRNKNSKTVEGEIETALKKLFLVDIVISGCSRTDSGVSAKKFYFTFECKTKLPADRVASKLNRFLPNDIQCQSSREVSTLWDLRDNVEHKTYRYSIYFGEYKKPLLNSFSTFVKGNLNIENMKKCANQLMGKHNYKSFCNQNADTTSFDREILDIKIISADKQIDMYFTAKNFLYNMVRILAGTLVECGLNKLSVEDINNLFAVCDRQKNIAKTMPAKSLLLYDVKIDL